MHTTHSKFLSLIAVFAVIIASLVIIVGSHVAMAAQASVDLGTAKPFAVLAGTPNITDAGNTSVINGDVGLSPATGAGIGLLCSQVSGAIYTVDAAGPLCRENNPALLTTVKSDLTTAYDDAAGRTPVTTVPTELGGTTLVAGVYAATSTTFGITAGAGPLVLDGQGDPSSVFIFQAPFSGTGLTVGSASVVSLVNGAQACNVFWRVNTASINSGATFVGTILALTSITAANAATIEGRLLARNGSVTLINNTITVPVCATTVDEGDGSGAGTGGTTNTGVVPGFPNTGWPSSQYVFWAAIALFVAAITFLFSYLIYKKRST